MTIITRTILAAMGLMLTLSLFSLSAPVQAAQSTPTPTPTPAAPPPPPGDSATDSPSLAEQIQQLTATVAQLQAEIQDLKEQISTRSVQSLISNNQLPSTTKTLSDLGGAPCPNDSAFTCVTLTVPLDHFDPANRQTLEVVFGVLPASGERKGMFVTATGGPGSSGLSAADSYAPAFDPSILEHFDLVFFDQRGMGESGGLQCPIAAAAYYETETDATTPEGEAAAVAAAQTFTEACLTEMGSPDNLAFLGTRQAVEDLDLFRQASGDDKLWLYGESYGTQFAQTYAAAHPDHLAAMILDGTVDLTLSGQQFLQQQAQAFNDVLVLTLQACNEDEDCAADMGSDALPVYDELAAQLKAAPRPFTFPLPSGGSAKREFTLADLETATATYLYSEGSRLLWQRALAAAARDDDLVPLARLLYDSLSLNPENLQPIVDPTFSDAIFYGVECNDYDYDPTADPAQNAEAYLRAGDSVEQSIPRLSSIFYGDLPCVFWPSPADTRPQPLRAEGIPTLVLGATADPATPVDNGRQVFSRLADGYLVTTQGGAHVIFGRGNACPDDLVTAFLVEGKMPTLRETECEGEVASAYVPLPPLEASAFESPLEALLSVDTEINHLPEYYYWDVTTPTDVGCPQGGTLSFAPGDEGDDFTFKECAFSKGFAMSGSGLYHADNGSFTLDVTVTGPEGVSGQLSYERNENGAVSVTGEYAGEKVDLSEED